MKFNKCKSWGPASGTSPASTGWALTGWRVVLWKRTWVSLWATSWTWYMSFCGDESLTAHWAAFAKGWIAVWGKWLPRALCFCDRMWSTGHSFGPKVQEASTKGSESQRETLKQSDSWAHDSWRQADNLVLFTVKKRRANGGSCCSPQILEGILERRWMWAVKEQEGIVTSCSKGNSN